MHQVVQMSRHFLTTLALIFMDRLFPKIPPPSNLTPLQSLSNRGIRIIIRERLAFLRRSEYEFVIECKDCHSFASLPLRDPVSFLVCLHLIVSRECDLPKLLILDTIRLIVDQSLELEMAAEDPISDLPLSPLDPRLARSLRSSDQV